MDPSLIFCGVILVLALAALAYWLSRLPASGPEFDFHLEQERQKLAHADEHQQQGHPKVSFTPRSEPVFSSGLLSFLAYEVCNICGRRFFTIPDPPPLFTGWP